MIVSGSEDGTVKMWNANTYRLEKTLNYGMERVWCAAYLKGSNILVNFFLIFFLFSKFSFAFVANLSRVRLLVTMKAL